MWVRFHKSEEVVSGSGHHLSPGLGNFLGF
jgi:hypothetical protein